MQRDHATSTHRSRSARRPHALRSTLAIVAAIFILAPDGVLARRGVFDLAPVRPLRIEGYWDRPRTAPAVIGEVTISADGRTRRTFGITAIQAYHPEEEGIQILRHSALQPVNLLLRGREELVQRFLGARTDEKVIALGVYRAGSGMFILNSVEIHRGSRGED
jgi:hypothetical protein